MAHIKKAVSALTDAVRFVTGEKALVSTKRQLTAIVKHMEAFQAPPKLTEGAVEVDSDFTFNVGDTVLYWYRVQGQCLQTIDCDNSTIDPGDQNCGPNTGAVQQGRTMYQYLAATSASDVCTKLLTSLTPSYPVVWPIKEMHRWSRPIYLSDIQANEADGIDQSCNILEPIEFENVPECMDLVLKQASHIKMGMTIRLEQSFKSYNGTGGLNLHGVANTGDHPNPHLSLDRRYALSGFVSTTPCQMGMTLSLVSIEANFPDVNTTLTPLPQSIFTVDTDCGCTSLPLILILTQNLTVSNAFSDFLVTNAFYMPPSFSMRYNNADEAWRNNFHFVGIGTDGSNEKWDLMFEWCCTADIGGDTLPNAMWKFSCLIRKRNLDTKRDSYSRAIYTFGTDPNCSNNDFSFSFSVNVLNEVVTPPYGVLNDLAVLADDIGIFNNSYWLSNPNLIFTVAEVANTPDSTTTYTLPAEAILNN